MDFRDLLQTMLLHHSFLVCPSAMVRTSLYKEKIREWGTGLFRSASDVDTWLRLSREQDIAILEAPLMRYRISGAQFSNLNRNRTERADFFSVMDHYLASPSTREFVTEVDLRHYRWLEHHERVARAFNLFGLGRVAESRQLLSGSFSWDALRAAATTRRGLVTLGGIVLLHLLTPFGATGPAGAIARAAKRIAWR
jgi:hypothetical protein